MTIKKERTDQVRTYVKGTCQLRIYWGSTKETEGFQNHKRQGTTELQIVVEEIQPSRISVQTDYSMRRCNRLFYFNTGSGTTDEVCWLENS